MPAEGTQEPQKKGLPSIVQGSPFCVWSMMKALILVNGELYQPDILRSRIKAEKFDLVIGADGGTRHANVLGVNPDAIIGDMDSLSESDRLVFKNAKFISYPAEKDETDLELAILYAREKGADEIVMVGVMGGRMDMTISNILQTAHLSSRFTQNQVMARRTNGMGYQTTGRRYFR